VARKNDAVLLQIAQTIVDDELAVPKRVITQIQRLVGRVEVAEELKNFELAHLVLYF